MGIRVIKRKKGTQFRAEIKIKGQRYSRTFSSEADALVWLETIKQIQTCHSGSNQYQKKMTMRQGCAIFIEQRERQGLDESTMRNYFSLLKPLGPILDKDISEIKSKELENLFKGMRNTRTGKPLSKIRAHKLLFLISEVVAIASKKGVNMVDFDLVRATIKGNIEKDYLDTIPKTPYKIEEVERLISPNIDGHKEPYWVLPMIKILIMTGKRIGEVLGLTNDKIHHEEMTIRIDQMVSDDSYKNWLKAKGKPHSLKMDQELSDVIKSLQEINLKFFPDCEWLFPGDKFQLADDFPSKQKCPYKGRPVNHSVSTKWIDRRMKAANVRDLNIHNLRSTYATLRAIQLLKKRDPLYRQKIQAELNQKCVETTDGYIRIAEEYLEEGKRENIISAIGKLKSSKQEQFSELAEHLNVNGIDIEDVDMDMLKNFILAIGMKNKKAA